MFVKKLHSDVNITKLFNCNPYFMFFFICDNKQIIKFLPVLMSVMKWLTHLLVLHFIRNTERFYIQIEWFINKQKSLAHFCFNVGPVSHTLIQCLLFAVFVFYVCCKLKPAVFLVGIKVCFEDLQLFFHFCLHPGSHCKNHSPRNGAIYQRQVGTRTSQIMKYTKDRLVPGPHK